MNIKNWKVNKRFVALALAGTISFSLVGCGSSKKLEGEIASLQSEVASLKDDVDSLKGQSPDSSTISSENQAVTTAPEESIDVEAVTTSPKESIDVESVTTSLEETAGVETAQEKAEQSDKTAEDYKGIYIEVDKPYYSSKYNYFGGDDDGYLRNVSLNGNIGVIDVSSRKTVISPSYKSVELDGNCFIVTQNDDKKRLVFINWKTGQLDVEGNMSDAYDTIGDVYYNRRYKKNSDTDGYVRDVTNGEKKGLIAAADGKVLIPTLYTDIGEEYYNSNYWCYADDDDDGYLRNVSIGDKNGIIDASDFSVVIPAEYSDIQFESRDVVVTDTEGLKKTLTYGSLKK